MKKLKKVLAIIMCVAMVTAMFACGVSAAETSTEEEPETINWEEFEAMRTRMKAREQSSVDERIAQSLEKLYSAEVPEEFFLIPKEKMVIEGWDWDFAFLHDKINKGELSWEMFEPLYSYISIVVDHDYLEPKGIGTEGFDINFSLEDLEKMKEYYSNAIEEDQLSYNLSETYSEYNLSDFKGDAELTECIMRALYTFCITAGVDSTDFWAAHDFEIFYGLSPEKITLSDEQLHYFDD